MTYKNAYLNCEIELGESNLCRIVIENENLFRKLILSFYSDDVDDLNTLIINSDEKTFSKYAEVMFSPFDLDINDKSIVNKFYETIVKNSKYEEEISELNNKINSLIINIYLQADFRVDYNIEFGLKDFLSFTKVHFYKSSDYLQRFVNSLKIYSQFLNKSVFIFVNIDFFFNVEELSLIKKEINSVGITIINICKIASSLFLFDSTLIIDNDLCEL